MIQLFYQSIIHFSFVTKSTPKALLKREMKFPVSAEYVLLSIFRNLFSQHKKNIP